MNSGADGSGHDLVDENTSADGSGHEILDKNSNADTISKDS